jgi:hypothetical protein
MNTKNFKVRAECASRLSIATLLGCASLSVGCSSGYALGDLSQTDLPLADDGAVASTHPQSPDFAAPAQLAPANVSISSGSEGAGSTVVAVGDLNGDGFEDSAAASYDLATMVAYIDIRYGGARPDSAAASFIFAESGAKLMVGGALPLMVTTMLGAGDVDADGYADMLIGLTPSGSEQQVDAGVFLLYGDAEQLDGLASLEDVAVHFVPPARTPINLEDGLSSSTSLTFLGAPGDLDGDGFSDFLLIDPQHPTLGNAGVVGGDLDSTAYLFYGAEQRFSDETAYTNADASFSAEQQIEAFPVGDINADTRADLLLGEGGSGLPSELFFVAGRAQRFQGALDLGTSATRLEGARPFPSTLNLPKVGDLDADGVDEVLLLDESHVLHLFYGELGLFAGGLDFAEAAATLEAQEGGTPRVRSAGDRDGDGDVELLLQFWDGNPEAQFLDQVAILSGSSARLSGNVEFPKAAAITGAPERFVNDPNRRLDDVFPAGDLDGDGAADLYSTSTEYTQQGEQVGSYTTRQPLLHIHYGTPGALTPLVR